MAPEARSSDAPETRRFGALSAMDASLQLPLLSFLVMPPLLFLLVLCVPFFTCAQRSGVAIAEIRALASFKLNLQDPLGALDGWDCSWTDLPPEDCYDYIIVGGRTAGCSFAIAGLQARVTPSTILLTPSPTLQDLQDHLLFSHAALIASLGSIAASSVSSSSTAFSSAIPASNSTGGSNSAASLVSSPFFAGSLVLVAPIFSNLSFQQLAFGTRIETWSPGRCLAITPVSIKRNSSRPPRTAADVLEEALVLAGFQKTIFKKL